MTHWRLLIGLALVAGCSSRQPTESAVAAGDDASAALDQYGRVRGVDGLFVADASIMPTITSSNTNLPSLMIGERFGEWFRDGKLD